MVNSYEEVSENIPRMLLRLCLSKGIMFCVHQRLIKVIVGQFLATAWKQLWKYSSTSIQEQAVVRCIYKFYRTSKKFKAQCFFFSIIKRDQKTDKR